MPVSLAAGCTWRSHVRGAACAGWAARRCHAVAQGLRTLPYGDAAPWLHRGWPWPAEGAGAVRRQLGSSQDGHYCTPGPPRMRSESPVSAPLAPRWSTTHSGDCAPPPAALASHARHPPRRLTRRLPESASGRHPMTRCRYAATARPQGGPDAIRRTLTTWQSLRTREAWAVATSLLFCRLYALSDARR